MSGEKKKLQTPFTEEKALDLHAGDIVYITGVIYTGRDSAHKRLVDSMKGGEVPTPFDLKDAIIYYVGPTPTPPGKVIGSAGPTTSGRMDIYSPYLMENGLRGMIGKGNRGPAVLEALKKYKCVYFQATGGAAALVAKRITKAEVIAYEDLGPEAIRRLEVVDFPVLVVNDCYGGDLFATEIAKYKQD
jgi:fumarate hydratase subunit beta